ncbi:hypothetical protein [Diaphorobacter aerolatus]|uniref:hypothetical protein n=1 Tax=Diaphorobacter aerolatus TaxID=1288495 RepID=UPI001D02465D|nr:hypothetical protein [Diaphorobacter aerolatus]
MKWSNKWWAAGTILLMGLLGAAHAACVRTNALRTDDTSQAPIRFGAVNLSDTYLQPDGTLLASTVVPSSNYTAGGTTANTVLWICDIADKPTLQFLVAVNGRDRVGGYYLARKAGGMDYVYATWFKNVGLRMSMNGVVLSRNWGLYR